MALSARAAMRRWSGPGFARWGNVAAGGVVAAIGLAVELFGV